MHSARLPAGSLTGIGLLRMIAFSSGHFYNAAIVVPVLLLVLTGIFLFIRF